MRSLRRIAVAGLFTVLGLAAVTVSQPAPTPSIVYTVSAAELLDINTATPDQLKALPGVGDAYAKRIIDGRPYTAKNQLVTRGILPRAVYDKIADRIVAHRPSK
jgi:DNA uptake protein ComE-like DNA-binding protein